MLTNTFSRVCFKLEHFFHQKSKKLRKNLNLLLLETKTEFIYNGNSGLPTVRQTLKQIAVKIVLHLGTTKKAKKFVNILKTLFALGQ